MERCTVMATINGALTQRPILEGNEISLPYTSFSPKLHFRDSSFSSHIRPEEPNPIAKERLGFRVEDTEISIFDAQRYFNEDQKERKKVSPVSINLDRIVERCDVSTIPRISSVSSADGYGRGYRTGSSFHATPTASSEASWNSQSGLLSNPPGSIAVSMRNLPFDDKKRETSTNWFFGRKCPCSGKKSVQVEEKFSGPKTPLHLNSTSNRSLNPKRQISKSGDVDIDAGVGVDKTPKEKNLDIDERTKMKLLNGNWAKEQLGTSDSGRISPEDHFQAEIGRRVVPSGRSFNDVNGNGNGFSFPILNPPTSGKLLLNGGKPPASELEDESRKSLDVFRPSDEMLVRKSTELHRRILMPSFPGDIDHQSFIFPASPKPRTTNVIDDDVASDASSDLFEIESFSTQTTLYPMYCRRDSVDEMTSHENRRFGGNSTGILHFRQSLDDTTTTQSIAPTECYEPSEASIDWSVTTADGFDRGSVTNFSVAASDYDDLRFMHPEMEKMVVPGGTGGATTGGGSGVGKRRVNGLLSCRCEKAVSVGPHPVKFVPEQRRVGNGMVSFPMDSGGVPATARLGGLSSMQVARGTSKPPLARSNSGRMCRALATH